MYWVYYYFNFVDEKMRLRKQIAQGHRASTEEAASELRRFYCRAHSSRCKETSPPTVLLRELFEGRNHLECYSLKHLVPGTWQMLKKKNKVTFYNLIAKLLGKGDKNRNVLRVSFNL